MHARAAQIGVDEEHAAVGLTHDRMCQVCGNSRFSFRWDAAGHEHSLERTGRRDLIQPRTERTKPLPANPPLVRFQEDIHPMVQVPIRVSTTSDRKSTRLNSSHLGISYAV